MCKRILLILAFLIFGCRMGCVATKVKRRALGLHRTGLQGRKRNFNVVSEEKTNKMMELSFQQRTEAKIRWAVNCYDEWRSMRLQQPGCDLRIKDANLSDMKNVTKETFEFALCRFIVEVKKTKNDADYPGKTLYQLVCALQNYLKKLEIDWKLVHGSDFKLFSRVLDNVIQERAAMSLGTVRKQAQVISLDHENQLWLKGILGEDEPDKLRSTVLYLLGVNLALRAGDEHYFLRRPGECMSSQISFELNNLGILCLVYREDNVTKTNRGGLRDMKKERKVVWVKPNSSWERCPVRIVQKYLNLLPKIGVKANLYLQSLKKPRPNCWYSTVPVGINKIRGVVSELLHNAGLDGYFTNHSLRRTCATRLFQAGQSVKLVKEVTGHVSDAVHKYQTTSDEQRMNLSEIVQGDVKEVKLSQADQMQIVEPPKALSDYQKFSLPKLILPVQAEDVEGAEGNQEISNSGQISEILKSAIKAVGGRKAKITMEVELLE